MLLDFGVRARIKLVTDASAAQGIASRRGLGQVKHIEVNQLWLQDMVNKNLIAVEKTGGKENIADTLTKYMELASLTTHMRGAQLKVVQGRHALAPIVESSINDDVFQGNDDQDEGQGDDFAT